MAIIDTALGKESRDRYLTYALSVVSGRALPDVRDGLKPVQRRILYAMLQNLNLTPTHSHRKSAAVVGEVLARFHPHGDIACYEAMVRMAQDFSLRYPLVDGQGNFGSLDGDGAAAYRYTEVRLRELAIDVIGEINEETVDFRPNFDATVDEPVVLPSRVPNMLINGASGIAVGMATSIPPHNIKDVIKALLELSAEPEITSARLATTIKGPDFPTGCLILNTRKEIGDMYKSGKGTIRMRGEWEEQDLPRGKKAIIISSIPYAVNKAQLVERIADLIIQKKVPQLVDVRDESTDDVRIVVELAPGADSEVAMAYVFKNTPLESNFTVNMTALVPNANGTLRPELLALKECLQHFLDFRQDVVRKRLVFEKKELEKRIHILEGLVKIFDALDEAIKIVRKSTGRADAAEKLAARFTLTEIQALAVVDMRIYQLSRTNIDEIRAELKEKLDRVSEIEKILGSKKRIADVVRKELEALGERYGDKRRSKLVQENIEIEFRAEDYVVQEDVYAIVTKDGWIKRIRQNNELSTTRLREGDSVLRAHPLNTVDAVAFFTNHGSLYTVKVTDFPSSSGYGTPIQKLLKFKDDETIVESFGVRAQEGAQGELIPGGAASGSSTQDYRYFLKDGDALVLVSKKGVGFALKILEIGQIKRSGKRAIKLREGDSLASVSHRDKLLALITTNGYGLKIPSSEIPERESAAVGVSLIGVRSDDALIAAIALAGKAKLAVHLEDGRVKEIGDDDVVSGHRALKGNKIGVRGAVLAVNRV